jgi:galactosylceramidase
MAKSPLISNLVRGGGNRQAEPMTPAYRRTWWRARDARPIVPPPLLVLCLILACPPRPAAADLEMTIDPARTGAEFEGIGAVSAGASSRLLIDYPEPARSRILDWLFLPKYGAGFQHLKVEVGGEINSTDGTEPTHARSREELDHPQREYFERGYEWWLMKEAKRRNPKLILDCLPWGAPGWIGKGNYCSQDMADYLVGFLKGARQFHELDIGLVGCWNEKEVTPEWIKLLRRTLDGSGLGHVRIVGGDMNGPPEAQWKIAGQAAADAELAKCLYAIGVHYPHGEVAPPVAGLRAAGIRTWSSEHGEWDWQTMLPFPHKRSASMHRAFLERGLTKINFWSPISSYYDCLPAPRSGVITANTPWSGAFEIMPTLWAVAHITQFAEPGWRFVEGAGRMLPKGGSAAGFVSPDGKDFSVVIETTEAAGEQTLALRPAAGTAAERLSIWRTDLMEYFIQQPDLVASNGTWNLTLAPNCTYSLTTTTGQRKGTAASPPPGPFPLPYYDAFEGYRGNGTARYLSDMGGAFEIVARSGGGQCLRQQVHRPGIDWAHAGYAYSVIGDDRWNDLEVSVEAGFEALPEDPAARGERFVGVLARWYPGATWIHFTTPQPAGYCFRIFGDGRWELTTARKVLARGTTTAPGGSWHHLALRCAGDRIEARLDDRALASVKDATYQRGLAGIASRFHPARFDNLTLKHPRAE